MSQPLRSPVPPAPPAPAPDPYDGRWWVLVTVGLGTFMSALDGSVVNTLLPVLARELRAGVADIEWVTTVYLLVISGLLTCSVTNGCTSPGS